MFGGIDRQKSHDSNIQSSASKSCQHSSSWRIVSNIRHGLEAVNLFEAVPIKAFMVDAAPHRAEPTSNKKTQNTYSHLAFS